MRRLFLILALSTVAAAQTTPNLNFNVPVPGTLNWGNGINQNFYSLDSFLSGKTSLPGFAIPSASNINGQLNPVTCSISQTAPSWCAGTDIGGWINSAVAQLIVANGFACGDIYIPAGNYNQSTSAIIPRCVHLHGASANSTRIKWTQASGWAFIVSDNQVALDNNYVYQGAIEDISILGPGVANTAGAIYFGGSDGATNSPALALDPASWQGDNFNLNRVRIFQVGSSNGFNVGIQWGTNSWRETINQSVVSFCGNGLVFPANIGNSNTGEEITIVGSAISNNTNAGILIGNGNFVNVAVVGTSFDFNGTWAIQNGTTGTSNNSISLLGVYIDTTSRFVQNFGNFYSSGGYWNSGSTNQTYLIDNENAVNFTISGGQYFNNQTGGGQLFNASGQCVSVIATGPYGSNTVPAPICNYLDRFGNATFTASVTTGGINLGRLNMQSANQFSGTSACVTNTKAITYTAYTSIPTILVFDYTTAGGANLSAGPSTTGFTVHCTGATDSFGWVAIGAPN